MSDIIGGIIGGLGSLGAGFMNMYNVDQTNKQNERLMREQWGREDNAVQRRAKDLEAAGMSPILAAGSSASAGQAVRLNAPQMDKNPVADAANMMSQVKAIERTNADIAKVREDTRNTAWLNNAREKIEDVYTRDRLAGLDFNTKEWTPTYQQLIDQYETIRAGRSKMEQDAENARVQKERNEIAQKQDELDLKATESLGIGGNVLGPVLQGVINLLLGRLRR